MLAVALRGVAAGRPLAGTAGRPGVRRRLAGLLEELAERGFTPAELTAALEALDAAEHGVDRQLVEDLGTVLGAVAARLDGLAAAADGPLPTPGAQALATRRALAADPARWGGRPVAFYGFDDLTFGQTALVRVLARVADVVVSLPYEDGRVATAARRPVVDELRAVAAESAGGAGSTGLLPLRPGDAVLDGAAVVAVDRHEVRLARPDAAGGRGRLERGLFEPPEGPAPPAAGDEDRPPLDDVVLVEGGSPRSEAEALVDELLRAAGELDLEWHDLAVAVREAAGPTGARLERELTARGVPVARPRELPARRTAVGAAVAALARLAVGTATPDDVVLVLRAGATRVGLDVVDRFAIELRREGITEARDAWRRAARHSPTLEGLDLLATVRLDHGTPTTPALAERLTGALPALEELLVTTTVPAPRDPERRALRRIGEHLRAVDALDEADPALVPTPEELADELAELPVPVGEPPGPGRLEIAAPGALRGRQVAVLALADLREQAFPAPDPVDPLVDRDARDVLARAGGVRLTVPVERLAAERTLFLELVARPTRRLLLSRAVAGPSGEAEPPAPFLADVLATLHPDRPRVVARGASRVRPAARRPVATPAPFGAALDDAGRETVRRVLLERDRFAVREVERLARCPVCWVVEHLARADDDEPTSVPQIHGTLVHAVLDRALAATVRDGEPYGAHDPEELVAAGRRALAELGPAAVAGLPTHRARVLLRRVDVGVAAVLRALPQRYDRATLRATEVVVDAPGDVPPVDLGDGALAIGRIDRLDRVDLPDGRTGLGVVDYKLGTGGAVACGRWPATGTLQAALYLAAATADGGAPPAYALYQPTSPVSGFDPGARPPAGVELRGVLNGRAGGPKTPEEVAAIVEDAHARAAAAVAGLRAGDVTPRPETSVHGDLGECDHPAIARLLP
nr:PD-(D/E)XK nuclease family protein [Patulibacter sp. SYSU D01012]